jgi:hypothetical protein
MKESGDRMEDPDVARSGPETRGRRRMVATMSDVPRHGRPPGERAESSS